MVPFENERVTVRSVPLLTLNPRQGATVEVQLGLSAPLIRRAIIANVDAISMPDLAAMGQDALTAAQRHPPVTLNAPRVDCHRHHRVIVELVRSPHPARRARPGRCGRGRQSLYGHDGPDSRRRRGDRARLSSTRPLGRDDAVGSTGMDRSLEHVFTRWPPAASLATARICAPRMDRSHRSPPLSHRS